MAHQRPEIVPTASAVRALPYIKALSPRGDSLPRPLLELLVEEATVLVSHSPDPVRLNQLAEAIQRALTRQFRKAWLNVHPHHNGEKFRPDFDRLTEAYQVLRETDRRWEYLEPLVKVTASLGEDHPHVALAHDSWVAAKREGVALPEETSTIATESVLAKSSSMVETELLHKQKLPTPKVRSIDESIQIVYLELLPPKYLEFQMKCRQLLILGHREGEQKMDVELVTLEGQPLENAFWDGRTTNSIHVAVKLPELGPWVLRWTALIEDDEGQLRKTPDSGPRSVDASHPFVRQQRLRKAKLAEHATIHARRLREVLMLHTSRRDRMNAEHAKEVEETFWQWHQYIAKAVHSARILAICLDVLDESGETSVELNNLLDAIDAIRDEKAILEKMLAASIQRGSLQGFKYGLASLIESGKTAEWVSRVTTEELFSYGGGPNRLFHLLMVGNKEKTLTVDADTLGIAAERTDLFSEKQCETLFSRSREVESESADDIERMVEAHAHHELDDVVCDKRMARVKELKEGTVVRVAGVMVDPDVNGTICVFTGVTEGDQFQLRVYQDDRLIYLRAEYIDIPPPEELDQLAASIAKQTIPTTVEVPVDEEEEKVPATPGSTTRSRFNLEGSGKSFFEKNAIDPIHLSCHMEDIIAKDEGIESVESQSFEEAVEITYSESFRGEHQSDAIHATDDVLDLEMSEVSESLQVEKSERCDTSKEHKAGPTIQASTQREYFNEWQCTRCGFLHEHVLAFRTTCAVCDTLRTPAPALADALDDDEADLDVSQSQDKLSTAEQRDDQPETGDYSELRQALSDMVPASHPMTGDPSTTPIDESPSTTLPLTGTILVKDSNVAAFTVSNGFFTRQVLTRSGASGIKLDRKESKNGVTPVIVSGSAEAVHKAILMIENFNRASKMNEETFVTHTESVTASKAPVAVQEELGYPDLAHSECKTRTAGTTKQRIVRQPTKPVRDLRIDTASVPPISPISVRTEQQQEDDESQLDTPRTTHGQQRDPPPTVSSEPQRRYTFSRQHGSFHNEGNVRTKNRVKPTKALPMRNPHSYDRASTYQTRQEERDTVPTHIEDDNVEKEELDEYADDPIAALASLSSTDSRDDSHDSSPRQRSAPREAAASLPPPAVPQKDSDLLALLTTLKTCLKSSPETFAAWLEGEDIHSIEDLREAVQDNDFVKHDMQENGLKGFKRSAFKKGVLATRSPETPPPSELICPISHSLMMDDPVVARDGFTYERAAIENWFRQERETHEHVRSPLLNQKMDDLTLLPSASIRGMAREFARKHPQLVDNE